MKFTDKLREISIRNNSLLCIGLDSDLEKIPSHLRKTKHPQFEFNKKIIDATFDLVCAYKPNLAFYEAGNLAGLLSLKFTVSYLGKKYPQIPIILDAKIGDIGNSNMYYAQFIFDFLKADAVTVHPFLGKESLEPFLDRKDKGIFVLCKTSNPGGEEYQDLKLVKRSDKTSKKPLYQIIAENVFKNWNYNGNCGLIVGATYPAQLEIVRHLIGSLPILIPGVGAQGGNIEKTVKNGTDGKGLNAIINSSRSIIFAGKEKDFAGKSRQVALKLRNNINKYR